jgi:tetratricopeptide (TPR) repeat protein
MNNQRRHQLEQNVLANYLERWLSKLLPLVKPIAITMLAGAAVFAIYSIYQALTSEKSSTAWTQYYFTMDGDAESFVSLADEFGRTSAGQWARYSAAMDYLREGTDALYTNRPEGVDLIRKAIAELELVKDSSIRELRRQARFGLAQAHESLGELEQSASFYESLLDSDLLAESEREDIVERVGYLQSPQADQFYSWFNSLEPKSTVGPDLSGDLSTPPDSPGITFDPADLPGLPPLGVESPTTEPAVEQPSAEDSDRSEGENP